MNVTGNNGKFDKLKMFSMKITDISHRQYKLFLFLCVCIALFLAGSTNLNAKEIELTVSSDRAQIYQGESFTLTVRVSGTDASPEPDLSAITDCTIKSLGSQSESRHSITIVNGVVNKTGFSGRRFMYEIIPAKLGAFMTGPVTLIINGRTLSQDGPVIQVIGTEQQDFVIINIEASRQSVLVDEPFEITLAIDIKQIKGRYSAIDPIDPANPPNLKIPYMDIDQPIAGLASQGLSPILQKMLIPQANMPGFTINEYKVQSDNFFFPERSVARFMFDRSIIQRGAEPYFRYTVSLSYIPKEEGSYTFGPVVFKGAVGIRADAAGRIGSNPIFAVGPACTVRVVPPPEENRPASYIGAIGTFLKGSASLDTQTCKVGDPLTLTLAISGDIRLENIFPPPLNEQAQLTRNFRIYEDTIKTGGDDTSREFIYTIRPMMAGTLELPPIELSYFNSAERCYKTIKTEPIPVRANEAAEIVADFIIDTATNQSANTHATTLQQILVPAPIDINPAGARPDSIIPDKQYGFALLFGPFICLIAVISRGLIRFHAGNAGKTRTRSTIALVLDQIRKAEKLSPSDPETARRLLCSSLKKYAGVRFGSIEAGLTPSDIRALLTKHSVNKDTVKQFHDILERAFNAEYHLSSAGPADPASDCRNALLLIKDIEHGISVKQHGSSKELHTLTLFLILLAMPFSASGRLTGKSSEHEFMWKKANAQMASALTEPDFLAAAQSYRDLISAGVKNGHIFYNLGTACLMAGQYTDAKTSLLRAERYMGTSWEIKRNMHLSLSRNNSIDISLPWYRVPFFWHYRLSASARTIIAIISFNIFWLAFALRIFNTIRHVHAQVMTIAIILFVIFGSSSLTSIHMESMDQRTDVLQNEAFIDILE